MFNRVALLTAIIAVSLNAFSDTPKVTSPQEMLLTGPSGLKMHTLAMITQGKAGEIDESFLPALQVCATNEMTPVRATTARVLGDTFTKDIENPNPTAVALLSALAKDEASEVRFNALIFGLTQIEKKSPELVKELVEAAAVNRDDPLYGKIVASIAEYQEVSKKVLDEKLHAKAGIAYFEIYEDLTGSEPPSTEKYLDLPSSIPRLFVIKPADQNDIEASKAEFEKLLPTMDIKKYAIETSGFGGEYTLFLTTYITRDNLTIDRAFADGDTFKITQYFWVTPQVELELEMIREQEKKQRK